MKQLRDVLGSNYLYETDVSIIKKLGHYYRICNLNAIRISGLETRTYVKKCSVNNTKLNSNLSRAKSKLREYVLCNPWDYFCTLTISPDKYDRHNLKQYFHDLSRFILNYNRYCNDDEKIKYIFVPEMHKDGAWHLHGFIKGIKQQDLYINENGYLGWEQYNNKFGYLSFSKIKDIEKCSGYVLKYITKDSSRSITALGNHIYYSSKGLETGKLIFKGKIELNCSWDYETENGYCRIKELHESVYDKFVRCLE